MPRTRIVYVLETGCYENKGVAGVFDSPEEAMAQAKGSWTRTIWTNYPEWPNRERVEHWQSWDNDLDWDEAASIRTEVVKSVELKGRQPAQLKTVIQTLNPEGHWDYVPATTAEADALMRAEPSE